MFNWVCPDCGSEVLPSQSECPVCAERKSGPVATEAPPEAPPPPDIKVKEEKRPHRRPRLPALTVMLLVAIGACAVGATAYYFVLPLLRAAPPAAEPTAGQKPAAAPVDTLARMVEVTGFRVTEDERQRLQIVFLVVNHSGANLTNLEGRISLRPTTAKTEEAPLTEFDFKVPSIGPYESREVSTTMETRLRAYELPDWQFLRADVKFTSPR